MRRFYRVFTINVLSKDKKNNTIFHLKIINFIAVKNCSILHGRVFVMNKSDDTCNMVAQRNVLIITAENSHYYLIY